MSNLSPPETVSELRQLYRSAEARAARLRVLVDTGRNLASARSDQLDEVLQASAKSAAYLAGYQGGSISYGTAEEGIPLHALGAEGQRVGTLRLEGGPPALKLEQEDEEAFQLLCQLIATAIDRAKRERRLEQVVGRLFSAQEDERRRVSQDLHDGIAQSASAIFRRLELRNEQTAKPAPQDLELAKMAKSLVTELRHVIGGLRPTLLDDLGLAAALSDLADRLRADGYEVYFNSVGEAEWPSQVATAFFRIGQEAIANIRKHSGGPCRVDIDLQFDTACNALRLRIRDYGQGLAPSIISTPPYRERLGLQIMQERMMAIGGVVIIKTPPEGGVLVSASLKEGMTS